MKKLLFVINFIYIFLLFPFFIVHADYVLPYPSYMPGNKLYIVSRLADQIKRYWYWGNIAQTKYHLDLSAKYLVETKILFEYKQYLLGVDALERSNKELKEIPQFISRAWREEKEIGYLVDRVKIATNVHEEILADLYLKLPPSYLWTPEKSAPTLLHLHDILTRSIDVRKSTSEQISQMK